MSPAKKSILDRLAAGELRLSTEKEVKSDPGYNRGIEATECWLEETRPQALGLERPTGRPRKVAPRRVTEVRGLRLETALWVHLESEAEAIGCSVNRYIEESIFQRIYPSDSKSVLPAFSNPEGWMWNPGKRGIPSSITFDSPAQADSAA